MKAEPRSNDQIELPTELMMIFQTARPQLAETQRKQKKYTAKENYEIARTIGCLAELNMQLRRQLEVKEQALEVVEQRLREIRAKFLRVDNELANEVRSLKERRETNARGQSEGRDI